MIDDKFSINIINDDDSDGVELTGTAAVIAKCIMFGAILLFSILVIVVSVDNIMVVVIASIFASIAIILFVITLMSGSSSDYSRSYHGPSYHGPSFHISSRTRRGDRPHYSKSSTFAANSRDDDLPVELFKGKAESCTVSENSQCPDETFGDVETVEVTLQSIGEPAAYTFIIDGKAVSNILPDSIKCKVPAGKHRVTILRKNSSRSVLYDNFVEFDAETSFSVKKKEIGYSVIHK